MQRFPDVSQASGSFPRLAFHSQCIVPPMYAWASLRCLCAFRRGKHMTFKPCPRCGKLIPCGMAYCKDCTQIRSVRRQTRRADSADNKQYRAFYRSAAWKRTSLAKLTAVSYQCEAGCKGCTGRAVEVHHIKPIQTPEGWALRLDWDNLEAVCVHCHNRRHRR